MATGKGLRVVGDAAAVAGAPLEEVALHAGRIFGALTQGGAAGESLNRLQELGILGGQAKIQIAGLTEAQRKGTQPLLDNAAALKLVSEALGKSEGAMTRLAQTFAGKVSTMRGNIDMLKIALGQGINEGLETGVMAMNEKLPQMQAQFQETGEMIGLTLSEAFQGNTKLLETAAGFVFTKMGEAAAGAFLFAFTKAMTRMIPALLDKFAEMRDSSPLMKFLTPLGTPAEAMADKLRELDNGQFDFGDFLGLTEGMLGSDEAHAELVKQTELLRAQLNAQKEADVLAGRRDIVNGEYGPRKYSR